MQKENLQKIVAMFYFICKEKFIAAIYLFFGSVLEIFCYIWIIRQYQRRETAKAITDSENIESALDYLHRKPNETPNIPINDILANPAQTTGHDTGAENGMVPIWV